MRAALRVSRVRRLQQELNLRLMLPVLAVVIMTALLGAFGAQEHIDRVFDRWLLDAARSLAGEVGFRNGEATIDLSAQGVALLTYDAVDRTSFEVLSEGSHLLGQSGIPVAGDREKQYGQGERAYDAHFDGRSVRVAQVPLVGPNGARATVLVAETLSKRHQARSDLLLTMAPAAALVLLAAFIVTSAVRRTVGTLERIAARWSERSHASLETIPIDDVPRELLPFASALNDLLERVRGMLARERQFAATVAHQLRTPLTGLRLGMARAAEAPDAATTRAILGELGEATQRTARLVQQLLSLSRLDPEVKGGLQRIDVDLTVLATEVGETYFEAALLKRIDVELDAASPGLHVLAVPELLSEGLGNLIDNAIRYTLPGGRVVIAVQDGPPRISVSDSGPGIPSDEREAVFDRFVRGRESSGDGTGLGLPIVREIAALHGATVSIVESELGGACVTIRFPAAA